MTATEDMKVLEREAPLAALAEYAAEARRGEGRLVLVAGEAGAGKSVLVEQLQREVPDARWSWGQCDGLFTPRPLGPLFDLADQLGGKLLELCRLGASREKLFRALLHQVSGRETLTALVVEDLHWADEATVDMLRFLGRRIRDDAVLLIATYRDDGMAAGDPLWRALGELARQWPTRRIRLAPLSEDAVRILAEGSRLEPAELYRLTGGNPFYVTEVLHAGMGEVPASARDAVLARAAPLGIQARTVLDVAALIGNAVELRLAESVTPCPPLAVDELLASGLLTGDGHLLRFRHEIARLAVEQAVAPHRRRFIHARILDALRAMGSDDDAQMAFHAEAAGDGPAVLHYAASAAWRAAELASHWEAAAQFERALRFASHANTATLATLYDGLADAVSLLGRWQDAADARERALALFRVAGNQLRLGNAMRRLAMAMWHLCRRGEAVAAAEAAVAILEPMGPSTELAWAYADLASRRMIDSEPAAAITLALRAQVIAERLAVPEVLSHSLNTQACAAADLGREWIFELRRALQIAVAAGIEDQAGRAYCNLYALFCCQCRFAEGEQYYVDGITYCDELDSTTYATILRSERASFLERTGCWDEAVALSEGLLNQDLSPVTRSGPLIKIGAIMARRGEPDAWGYLDEAARAAGQTGEPQRIVPARLARAEAYWLDGNPGAAVREAELADDVSANCDAWTRGAIGAWLLRTGSARPPRGDLAEPYQRQIDGDWEGAAKIWASLDCSYEAALAWLGSAEEGALRAALTIFTSLGAAAAASIARRKMRALGIRSVPSGPRPATREHPLGLTRREREVLALICRGYTNAEIAARLVISTKTVDHHVSAVLAKLDVPTRSLATARAVALGLVGPAELRTSHSRLPG